MAVGQSGKPVASRDPVRKPSAFAARVGAHIHKGAPEATIGGPGCTTAPGASLAGSSPSSPYTDADSDGM